MCASASLSVSSNTHFCSFIDLSDSYRYSYYWDDDDDDDNDDGGGVGDYDDDDGGGGGGGGGGYDDDDDDGDVKLNISWVEWPTMVTYVQEVYNTGPSRKHRRQAELSVAMQQTIPYNTDC